MHCGTIPGRGKISVLQSISHKAHSASYTVSIRGSFSGVKSSGVNLSTRLHPVMLEMIGAIPPFSVFFDVV